MLLELFPNIEPLVDVSQRNFSQAHGDSPRGKTLLAHAVEKSSNILNQSPHIAELLLWSDDMEPIPYFYCGKIHY